MREQSRGRKALPVLTGEIVEAEPQVEQEAPRQEAPPQEEDPSGPSFRERWEKAREHFATRAQQRWDDRRTAENERRERMNASEGLSEVEEITLMRDNVAEAGRKYMQSLKDSDIFAPGFSQEEKEKKVSALHSVYAQMMVASCMRPLQEGVNSASVVRAASTMAAMWMVSSQFRQVVREYAEPVKDAIQSRIDDKAVKTMDWATREAEKQSWRGKKVEPSDLVAKRWQKRFDDIQRRERGNRDLYTPRSAGMTEVALAESAFEKMREPGADIEQILDSHEHMRKLLYKQAEDDGITPEELAQSSRVVLGERLKEEPRLQAMVDGLSHGAQRMSPPHEERIAGTDRTQMVWRGEFEDCRGRPVDTTLYADPEKKEGVRGAFSLRGLMGAADHRDAMAETMASTMAQAIERGDMQAFNQDMAGYMLGCIARTDKLDGEGMIGRMPERLFQSRTMLASMSADGLSETEQREMFSHAYADALGAVQEIYPEFSAQWAQTHGASWQAFTEKVGADPAEAYENWAAQQKAKGRPVREPGQRSTAAPEQDQQADRQPV